MDFSIDDVFSLVKLFGIILLLIASKRIMHSMAIEEVDAQLLDFIEKEVKLTNVEDRYANLRTINRKATETTNEGFKWMILGWALYLTSSIFTIFANGRLI